MFEVAASVTPRANSPANRLPSNIASAMSVTTNSSKQMMRVSSAISSATSSSGFSTLRCCFQPFVHGRHEAMEVLPAFVVERQRVVEEIHDEGLAAPDAAPEIEPAHRRCASCRRASRPCRASRDAARRAADRGTGARALRRRAPARRRRRARRARRAGDTVRAGPSRFELGAADEMVERLRVRERVAVADGPAVNRFAHRELDDLAVHRARNVGDGEDLRRHVARARTRS